jgi:hypothetical protein
MDKGALLPGDLRSASRSPPRTLVQPLREPDELAGHVIVKGNMTEQEADFARKAEAKLAAAKDRQAEDRSTQKEVPSQNTSKKRPAVGTQEVPAKRRPAVAKRPATAKHTTAAAGRSARRDAKRTLLTIE